MAFGDDDNSTYEQVTAWRDQLFDNRSLRISVEELSKWPLGRYLWAAVFQAAGLDGLRERTEHQWQTPAWDFGRFAKAHPLLVNLDENRALVEIKKAIGWDFWIPPRASETPGGRRETRGRCACVCCRSDASS